jgi:hypothetical protein
MIHHGRGCPLKALSWINFVLGLWLIVAAFALPGKTGAVMAEESVAGIAVVVLAYVSAVGRPRPGISWSVATAALWILIVNYDAVTPSKVNAMIVGLIVLVLGTANAMYWHVPAAHRRAIR